MDIKMFMLYIGAMFISAIIGGAFTVGIIYLAVTRAVKDEEEELRKRREERRLFGASYYDTVFGYYPEKIKFRLRSEAEEVLSSMISMINDYGSVTVADLYALVNKPTRLRDSQFGWTNLRAANVRRDYHGYLIILPRIERLKGDVVSKTIEDDGFGNLAPVIFDDCSEAEEVLSGMRSILKDYNVVTLSDLYDLVGISGDFTSSKYGWTDLQDAIVKPSMPRPTLNGDVTTYLLHLPPAHLLGGE